jgi:hypothetical protein
MTDNKKRVVKLKQIDLRYEKDTINKILFYYINHIDFTPNYNDTQEFINEVCVVANEMSGCFGADYINHKVYAYLFEYAIKNDEPVPNGVFADCDDIMSYNYEENEEYSSNKCETCKSICGSYGCGNEDCEDYDPTGIYEETERDNMKDMLSEM